MQKVLDIVVNSNKENISFSTDPRKLGLDEYLTHEDFWKLKELKKVFKTRHGMGGAPTVSEWRILELMFLQMLYARASHEQNCDFVLFGVAWENDESNIRHISYGNWDLDSKLKEDESWNNIYNNSSYNHNESSFQTSMRQALSCILTEHGIEESDFKDVDSYSLLECAEESLIWRMIAGTRTNWKKVVADSVEHVESEEPLNYYEIQGDCDIGHSLFLLYPSIDGSIKSKALVECWVTEPALMADGNQIEWYY